MKRRDLLLALMGVASLAQLPTVLAAPTRKQTQWIVHTPDAIHVLPTQDFTVDFWMAYPAQPSPNGGLFHPIWFHVALFQEQGELKGAKDGMMTHIGLGVLDEPIYAGAAILAQMIDGAHESEVVPQFMAYMQRINTDGFMANLRVTVPARQPQEAARYVASPFLAPLAV